MRYGLSALQRYIVAKAATVDRLYYADILQEYYGWRPVTRPRSQYVSEGVSRKRYDHGQQIFSPDQIGCARYHATMVTLSRTTARLERRGLVTCLHGVHAHWSGVKITPEGRRMAAAWGPGAASPPSEQEGTQAHG
jgi:hypothetical protein